MFPHAKVPFTSPPIREVRRREVVGWQEWDYLDYADFEKAMKEDQPISYALCQWLVRHLLLIEANLTRTGWLRGLLVSGV